MVARDGGSDPLLGRVLSDRYKLEKRLGAGGMGQVYRANDAVLDRQVAIKVLGTKLAEHPDLIARFKQEAIAASATRHENIIDIIDFSSSNGLTYIVMEHLNGTSLESVIKRAGIIPWERARSILDQIAKALRVVHGKNIVHRDMKPDNVFLLQRDDGRDLVKVLDFGIAKLRGDKTDLDSKNEGMTTTGMVLGTPEYMAPEQARGDLSLDLRADVYAVGCIMYRMLTGRYPFEGPLLQVLQAHCYSPPEPLATHVKGIPDGLSNVVMTAMKKDPDGRFQTMDEFRTAVAAAVKRRPWADWMTDTQRSPSTALFERALHEYPGDPKLLFSYAEFLANTDPDAARNIYEHAVEVDPGDAYKLGCYAMFLHARKDFERANEVYRCAIRANSTDAAILGNYAALLEEQSQFEAAEKMYTRALEKNPKHIGNLTNYALFLSSRGRRKDAVQACQQAIKFVANRSPEHEQLTRILDKIRA